ncbi:hypothetical protein [Massilia phyllosphaerae]|uniref:hypothetical protein n=1 Tax=Massilia phyllosphaerae TaxID=3106034 RepID=UPI002B1CC0D6|nr:hypothetical protein [Massilia sp. SGZ-792]
MGHLLSSFFALLRRYALLFIGIVLILVCGSWLRGEWRQVRAVAAELPALRTAQQHADTVQARLRDEVMRDARRMSAATLPQLDARMREVDAAILRLERQQAQLRDPLALLRAGADTLPARLEQAALQGIELELRRQERAWLATLRSRLGFLLDQEAARRHLEGLRLAYLGEFQVQEVAKKQLAAAYARQGWFDRVFPYSATRRQLRALETQVAAQTARTDAALVRFRRQKALVEQLPRAPDLATLAIDERRLAAAAAPLAGRLRRAETFAAQSVAWQTWQVVKPVLGAAVAVLVSWIVVPFAIRAVFYFVLAPLAARARPIVIAGPRDGDDRPFHAWRRLRGSAPQISAVSQRLTLGPGDEMLIRPAYCQSQPEHVEVGTKLLFDWSYWLPSIAAHLWLLNRLHAPRAAEIVVSSTVDPLEEVALLEIPAGAAFVLQARGLAGVLYRRGQRPRIRSHWRLGTLHAWLTLQLRYLSFEGPATLVVKGRRGVRLENAGAGRLVSQDATLGFSTNTHYSTVRARPFLPYMLGRRALLDDRFAGDDAYYLYEEIPARGQAGYRDRNPLEALVDAGLKALGV